MRRDEEHMEHDGRRTRWAPRGRHARRRRGGQVGVAGQESGLDGSWQERTWIRGKKADKMEKPKRTGSASAGLESGSRSEATCSKGGPIYSTGTDTDVGGQTGEDEYIRWRTHRPARLVPALRCFISAARCIGGTSEDGQKTARRSLEDAGDARTFVGVRGGAGAGDVGGGGELVCDWPVVAGGSGGAGGGGHGEQLVGDDARAAPAIDLRAYPGRGERRFSQQRLALPPVQPLRALRIDIRTQAQFGHRPRRI
ncbi:hypothetical protein K466DRAFT_291539 [Polyporus arcularius HHB13444]|uniref:Uncharacterized protein n=1 Tax=Polyporus arcularius HHB13444 TaxID=1314778 RepID=A0A5C3PXY3_9APHY|nr:hypothetical protein K466DRAFT_291539 [Polyporus arcularius HHB13444]